MVSDPCAVAVTTSAAAAAGCGSASSAAQRECGNAYAVEGGPYSHGGRRTLRGGAPAKPAQFLEGHFCFWGTDGLFDLDVGARGHGIYFVGEKESACGCQTAAQHGVRRRTSVEPYRAAAKAVHRGQASPTATGCLRGRTRRPAARARSGGAARAQGRARLGPRNERRARLAALDREEPSLGPKPRARCAAEGAGPRHPSQGGNIQQFINL